MTSNIGSEYIIENNNDLKQLINKELHTVFKPEFLNRIDEIVMFNPLNKQVLYDILNNTINDLNKRLENKHITIELTNTAKDAIIENAYSPNYGARPLKRYVSKTIESLIANNIISDNIKYNSKVKIEYVDNEYQIIN